MPGQDKVLYCWATLGFMHLHVVGDVHLHVQMLHTLKYASAFRQVLHVT